MSIIFPILGLLNIVGLLMLLKKWSRGRAAARLVAAQRKRGHMERPTQLAIPPLPPRPLPGPAMHCYVFTPGARVEFELAPRDRKAWGQPASLLQN